MFQQLLKQFLQKFVKNMGRQPQTPGEWMRIQDEAVRYLNKTKGAPPIKKEPFQGWKPKVIEGGKGQNAPEVSGIDSLLKSDFEKAVKPKKDRMNIRLMKNWEKELTDIDLAQEGYNLQEIGILQKARNVMKKEGQNPDDALQWVKSEMADAEGVDIEDFMPDFDWGDFPGKRDFAEGGIAPLVGEPTYAADFYDDRTPMEEGGMTQEDFNQFLKEREEGYHEGGKHELEKDWKRYKRFKKYGKGAVQEAAEGGRIGMKVGRIVKGVKKLLKKKKTVPEVSGIDDVLKSDFEAMTKPKVKKVDKNRKLTDEEWREYVEENSGDLNEELLTGNETLNDLENMVAQERAYADDMYQQYKRGDLDKYVKPEVLEEQRLFRQKKIDNVLAKAYDEVFYQKPVSGDYKYDADVLSDSIAEQLGKGAYTDLPQTHQTQIYNTALKRVTQDLKINRDRKLLKDVEQKMQLSDFDVKGRKGNAEGGRAEFIFGGSAGLKAMWKKMMQGISKRRGEPVPKLFPKLSADERRMEKLVMGTPEQKAFREGEEAHKLEGIDLLINRLKHDKKIIERQAKNKAMGDSGLDFLMKDLEKSMSDVYGPHLKKYTDIDKDILQMENIKKNLIMKDRKLNAEGGRIEMGAGGIAKLLKKFIKLKKKPKPKGEKIYGVGGKEIDVADLKKKHGLDAESLKKDEEAFKLRLQQILAKHSTKHAEGGRIGYSGGGSAGLPAVTMGSPHSPPMKQPQMPGGPQPTGIPGGTIVAPNNTQQNPWMGQNPNMNQGIGGMPRPQPGGMPRPQPGGMPRPQPGGMPRTMAAEGGSMRMPFGLGGINKGRRAFMKWIAGLTGAGILGGSGLLKLGKAAKVAKVAPKVAETIVSSNAAGMPAWFPSLVKRVLKEGEDITGKAGSEAMERQTVHTIKLPDSGTPIEVTRDLVTDDIIVDIGLSKHGFASGKFGQPVRLELKKGEWIEPNTTGGGFTTKGGDNVYPGMSKGFSETAETSGKNMKSKDEFWVEEAEFSGGHPENVKFEDSSVNQFGKHESDFSEVEAFATGKSKKGARKASESLDKQGEDLADHFSNYPEPDDFASGGIAHLLGE